MKQKINFLENKKPNFKKLIKILKPTVSNNAYTNFGPLQRKLENYIEKKLNLKKRKILMLNSATSGIHLLSKFFELKLNKNKIKWIVCDFNFYSSNILELSNSKVIDCDENGIFNLQKLKKYIFKNKNKNIGVIYTNIFGINPNWLPIKNICKKYNIPFFIDNATGLFDRPKNSNDDFEVVSFHQTKFWGFGEGGCIIVPKKYYKIVKSMTNFGADNFLGLKKFSSNFKISEFSCALIYQRLLDINKKEKLYKKTSKYFFEIISKNNLKIKKFSNRLQKSVQTYTPYLCEKPISQKKLNNARYLTLRKYYRPLKNLSFSKFIYDRIICIPNNPDYLKVSKKNILYDLIKILKN